jgi:metal-responsive CopG/Arc/MetJ family transcriptional regulator
MSQITVSLPEDRLRKLEEIAARFNVSAQELVRVSIEELLSKPADEFESALNYVLRKNAELYRRLS